MSTLRISRHTQVKVYHGFGHQHNLIVYGHVYHKKSGTERKYSNNILSNIFHLMRLFFIKPVAGASIRLQWRDQLFDSITEADGFFRFEWASNEPVAAGWHPVSVSLLDKKGGLAKTGEGKIFVPHHTQFACISDIDDTVMVSHSATIFRRLRVLFTKNPRTRSAFAGVVEHYRLLSLAGTNPDVPNPFFYVSSSEWNLYDDLVDFFFHNQLPDGTFLLNQLKRWHQLIKTGKTSHEGKLLRIYRVLEAFPLQRFILFGDNSQADPSIYATICAKYPEKIVAVYIRNVVERNVASTKQLLAVIENKKIFTCLFINNEDAIMHSKKIGLIS